MQKEKLLIIRFSSFGDIIQTLSVVECFLNKYPQAEIHWAVRADFLELLKYHPKITKIWSLDRKQGFAGLWKLTKQLQSEKYTHVYDAHNNLRSRFLSFFLWPKFFLRRGKDRLKRFLLFNFRINFYPKRLLAHDTYINPLKKWNIPNAPLKNSQLYIPEELKQKIQSKIPFKTFTALIPSAAWALKRWPIEYWKQMIEASPDKNYVILGGPQDTFLNELVTPENKSRVLNLSGQLSLLESCAVVSISNASVGCDTGLSHAADQLGIPIVFLTGPTAFGLPSRASSKSMEVDLWCRPCSKDGRGKCKNSTYKKCLYDIKPKDVHEELNTLGTSRDTSNGRL
ncbi:MAG: glycosyltransferase family 9 protein [Bdellovibrionota bacterium]